MAIGIAGRKHAVDEKNLEIVWKGMEGKGGRIG